MRTGKKESNKYRMLRAYRQLSPEYQAELLELVRQAYSAEKSPGHISPDGGDFNLIQQEYSCRDILQRSNK